MKYLQHKLIVLLIIVLAFPHTGSSQDSLTEELNYEVYINYPPLSISKETLYAAHTLIDLNQHYQSAWVKEYISVEILTTNKGKISNAGSKNDTLSQEQKNNMYMADVGTNISVKVRYIPDNDLPDNDIKEINFTFLVNPDREAKYPGGQQQLKKYLREKAIDNIPDTTFKNYDLAAVRFIINEGGQITDAHVFWSSGHEKTDDLLLETICNMPEWKPAQYANGTIVKQEFVLTVGNMENCVVNLLNIQMD